jgi:hypothetical protein
MDQPDEQTLWYHTNLDVFLNHWFSSYEEARIARARERGFLLPYKRHFFVCKAEVISALGLDPDDPDWEKIGWDCARPLDEKTFERLREKRQKVVGDSQTAP